jgi:hypothetical protein
MHPEQKISQKSFFKIINLLILFLWDETMMIVLVKI